MTKLSRRAFLKVAGAGTAAVAVYQAAAKATILRALTREEQGAAQDRQEAWRSTICQQCQAGCGLLVRVVDGRAVKIEGNPLHPLNNGKICPKAQAGLQVLYDPDRTQGPLRRVGNRGDGRWESISWDEAIEEVASRLGELRDRGDSHTMVLMTGRVLGQMEGLISRFCDAYGTPNRITHNSICASTVEMAHWLSQGQRSFLGYDWERTRYLLSFGASFLEAWRPTVRNAKAYGYMRRGRAHERLRMVQVDTRFSITAAKADEWVPIRPGTDGALALCIAYVIINEELYDEGFVTQHTLGFEDWTDEDGAQHMGFKTLVLRDYAPSQVEAITGVPAETITRIAREFAATRPAVAIGDRGISMWSNGLFNQMAVHGLNALVGSIDVSGGVLTQRDAPFLPWPDLAPDPVSEEGRAQSRIDFAGTRRYPLACGVYQQLPDSIASDDPYPVNALLLYYTNPLFSSAEVARFHEAIEKVPFIVSFSPFLDDSTAHADLILPDHTYLERLQDVEPPPSLGYPVVGLGLPVVAPLFDTRHTGDVLLELARRLGEPVSESFPWGSFAEVVQYRTSGLWLSEQGDITATEFEFFWEEFARRSVWSDASYRLGDWERVLATPSGRFEFYSQTLRDELARVANGDLERVLDELGVQARGDEVYLPHYEPPETVGDHKGYPFFLNTYKLMAHAEGRGANLPHLQEMLGLHVNRKWDSWVEINPGVARALGIADDDWVWVESPLGERIKVRAVLYSGARPDVVNIPFELGHRAYGRWSENRGVNPNWLIANQTTPLTGALAPFATMVRIDKA
ncbi:MAG: molybdopterin-dependent oxidoreductase [Anaerolineae bacterium]|nr:molybdopterin-dependent oxidoreductase [Anaerolineae bacterium]NIN99348.1 molybdopterin-dependent oxidoreductase [Anaerolineae bacterium]NIQ82213.1 molybdopterin-dependent oxidoreductase [Anaerolineae bacterium]